MFQSSLSFSPRVKLVSKAFLQMISLFVLQLRSLSVLLPPTLHFLRIFPRGKRGVGGHVRSSSLLSRARGLSVHLHLFFCTFCKIAAARKSVARYSPSSSEPSSTYLRVAWVPALISNLLRLFTIDLVVRERWILVNFVLFPHRGANERSTV